MNLRALFLLGCLAVACACSTPAPRPAPEEIPGMGMTNLRVLLRSYSENNLTANKLYGNRWVKVRGLVVGKPGANSAKDGSLFVCIAETPDINVPEELFARYGDEAAEPDETEAEAVTFDDAHAMDIADEYGGLTRYAADYDINDASRNINSNRRAWRDRKFLVCAFEAGQEDLLRRLKAGDKIVVFGLVNSNYWQSGEAMEFCRIIPDE